MAPRLRSHRPSRISRSHPTSMVPLLILFLALVLIVFPIWALLKILALEGRNERLEQRLRTLEEHSRPASLRAFPPAATPPPVIASSQPPAAVPATPPVAVPPSLGSL